MNTYICIHAVCNHKCQASSAKIKEVEEEAVPEPIVVATHETGKERFSAHLATATRWVERNSLPAVLALGEMFACFYGVAAFRALQCCLDWDGNMGSHLCVEATSRAHRTEFQAGGK